MIQLLQASMAVARVTFYYPQLVAPSRIAIAYSQNHYTVHTAARCLTILTIPGTARAGIQMNTARLLTFITSLHLRMISLSTCSGMECISYAGDLVAGRKKASPPWLVSTCTFECMLMKILLQGECRFALVWCDRLR